MHDLTKLIQVLKNSLAAKFSTRNFDDRVLYNAEEYAKYLAMDRLAKLDDTTLLNAMDAYMERSGDFIDPTLKTLAQHYGDETSFRDLMVHYLADELSGIAIDWFLGADEEPPPT